MVKGVIEVYSLKDHLFVKNLFSSTCWHLGLGGGILVPNSGSWWKLHDYRSRRCATAYQSISGKLLYLSIS